MKKELKTKMKNLIDSLNIANSLTYTKGEAKLGGEINSRQSGLMYALTNPTITSPKGYKWSSSHYSNGTHSYRKMFESKGLQYNGDTYADVEQAYQHLKVEDNQNFNNILMIDLISCKLKQYPILIRKIYERGKLEFILDCTHQPTKEDNWYHTSGENGFIKLLAAAWIYLMIENKEYLDAVDKYYTLASRLCFNQDSKNKIEINGWHRYIIGFPDSRGQILELIHKLNNSEWIKDEAILDAIDNLVNKSVKVFVDESESQI